MKEKETRFSRTSDLKQTFSPARKLRSSFSLSLEPLRLATMNSSPSAVSTKSEVTDFPALLGSSADMETWKDSSTSVSYLGRNKS